MTKTTDIQSIVILTGAGISAESGLDTFRGTTADGGGIWADHKIEDVATPEAFARDPVLVHQFYKFVIATVNVTDNIGFVHVL